MKGFSTILTNIMLVSITILTLSLVFLYYQSIVGKVATELEENSPMDSCTESANLVITNFDGENLTIRNNGGIALNVLSFHIYSMYKEIGYTYVGNDTLEPGEKIILKLSEMTGPGVLKVTGECEVGDEIDTRFLDNCGDGICSYKESPISCPDDC